MVLVMIAVERELGGQLAVWPKMLSGNLLVISVSLSLSHNKINNYLLFSIHFLQIRIWLFFLMRIRFGSGSSLIKLRCDFLKLPYEEFAVN